FANNLWWRNINYDNAPDGWSGEDFLEKVVAGGNTYYVATNGSDSNPGTASSPFRSIQTGVNAAVAGDTVIVMAGTYFERVIMPNSGTSASRITVKGTKSGSTFQTIVDQHDTVLTNWTQDFAVDPNGRVWKTTKPTWSSPEGNIEACSMTADGLNIWHINYNISDGRNTDPFWFFGHNALSFLAISPTEEKTYNEGTSVQFSTPIWQPIQALFANVGSSIYLRFKDGDNPNSKAIRVLPFSQQCALPSGAATRYATFLLDSKNYITIQDLDIVGKVALHGNSGNNIVTGNKIRGGDFKVVMANDASGNTISSNEIFGNSIAYTAHVPGMAQYYNAPVPDSIKPTHIQYSVQKFIVGEQDGTDYGIIGGTSTIISGNTFYNQELAIYAGNLSTISGNTFHNHAGTCLYFQELANSITIANNLFYECSGPIRSNYYGHDVAGFTAYIYGNKFYNVPSMG
ncbi:MAG: DUF1565 domain-containing protein, partial [Patescibacteria group bacterium]